MAGVDDAVSGPGTGLNHFRDQLLQFVEPLPAPQVAPRVGSIRLFLRALHVLAQFGQTGEGASIRHACASV